MAVTAEALRHLPRESRYPLVTPLDLRLVPPIVPKAPEENLLANRQVREYTEEGFLSDREREKVIWARTMLWESGPHEKIYQRVRHLPGRPSELDIFIAGDRRSAFIGARLQKAPDGQPETIVTYTM